MWNTCRRYLPSLGRLAFAQHPIDSAARRERRATFRADTIPKLRLLPDPAHYTTKRSCTRHRMSRITQAGRAPNFPSIGVTSDSIGPHRAWIVGGRPDTTLALPASSKTCGQRPSPAVTLEAPFRRQRRVRSWEAVGSLRRSLRRGTSDVNRQQIHLRSTRHRSADQAGSRAPRGSMGTSRLGTRGSRGRTLRRTRLTTRVLNSWAGSAEPVVTPSRNERQRTCPSHRSRNTTTPCGMTWLR